MNYLSFAADFVLILTCTLLAYRMRKLEEKNDEICSKYKACQNSIDLMFDKFQKRISDLENGSVPDYEKAKEAAKAVNDFNVGLSNILGYDPVAVMRKQSGQEE